MKQKLLLQPIYHAINTGQVYALNAKNARTK
jgi:hypothetical protein